MVAAVELDGAGSSSKLPTTSEGAPHVVTSILDRVAEPVMI